MLIHYLLFRLLCFRYSISGFCYSGILERHLSRRQTTLVITSSIFQITFDCVSSTREFYFLHKLCCILEIAYLHFEQFIESRYFFAYRLQFAYKLDTRFIINIECCGNRAAISQIGRINMPTFIHGSCKHHLCLRIGESCQLCFKLYRIFDLRLQCIYNKA